MEKLDKAEEISRKVCMFWSFFIQFGNWSSPKELYTSRLQKMLEWIYSLAFFLLDWFTYG